MQFVKWLAWQWTKTLCFLPIDYFPLQEHSLRMFWLCLGMTWGKPSWMNYEEWPTFQKQSNNKMPRLGNKKTLCPPNKPLIPSFEIEKSIVFIPLGQDWLKIFLVQIFHKIFNITKTKKTLTYFKIWTRKKYMGPNFPPSIPSKRKRNYGGMMGIVLGWIIFGEIASSAPFLARLPTTTTTHHHLSYFNEDNYLHFLMAKLLHKLHFCIRPSPTSSTYVNTNF